MLQATQGQRLRTALRRGLKVRVTGATGGSSLQVRAVQGKRTVAAGHGRAGATITLRFTAKARRALARKRTVKLRIVSGTMRAAVTLRRWTSTIAAPTRRRRYPRGMCRNIRPLHNFEPEATDEEVRAAALQYVRKISGASKPSQANAEAFERAVDAVAAASARLLAELVTTARPKDRETEAAKARERSAQRFAA